MAIKYIVRLLGIATILLAMNAASADVFTPVQLQAGMHVITQTQGMTCAADYYCPYTGGSPFTSNAAFSFAGAGCGFPRWTSAIDQNVRAWLGKGVLSWVNIGGTAFLKSTGNGAIIINKQIKVVDAVTKDQTIINPGTYMGSPNSAYRYNTGLVQAYDDKTGIAGNVKLQFVEWYGNEYDSGHYYLWPQEGYLRVIKGAKSYYLRCERGW